MNCFHISNDPVSSPIKSSKSDLDKFLEDTEKDDHFKPIKIETPTNDGSGIELNIPGPLVQNFIKVGSWFLALFASLFAYRNNEFGIYWRLPITTTLWCMLYIFEVYIIKKVMGAKGLEQIAGYPRWSFVPGITHGGFFLVVLFAYAFYEYKIIYPGETHLTLIRNFLTESWTKLPPKCMYALEQIFCCVNGYFLKDYYLFSGLDSFFLNHHLASIFGSCICLSFPTGAGFICLNGVMGEIGSVFYNLKELAPGK